ncbi:P-loop containing nucleoside triphosphate hydrolase protein [Gilbertella persicaria]|uniref:P-loop containing nucleoside triphosphate hydrolase protein n=1 Tax=Gilbertella persicaria TaxID=101096 RepID=UPI00221FF34F|nr:P-loop containing nucleoside triphosphate hydrolase protein [Gilbertella persicaria]KAI8087698.1 P-loop containing nucleoside triphosphate hydrolase protein [Gilbertella persicaria]
MSQWRNQKLVESFDSDEWNKPVKSDPNDQRWNTQVERAGGWGNRTHKMNDFETRKTRGRGGYQSGRGHGCGGHQQQRQNTSWHQQKSLNATWGNQLQSSTSDWSNAANAWDQKPQKVENSAKPNGWSTVASTKPNAWNQKPEIKQKNEAASNYRNIASSSTNDWNTACSSTNDWHQESKTEQKNDGWNTTTSNAWDQNSKTKPSVNTWQQQEPKKEPASEGWDAPAKASKVGEWGTVTLENLGWNESGKRPKDTKEAGRGIWKDGKHELGEEYEEIKLKLFGTATNTETIHSGINFDKYDNIPVEVVGHDPSDALTTFEDTQLDNHLRTNIQLARYKVPTPVQKHSVPIVLKGNDLMACAQTGSGKTAGFLFPILSAMFSRGPKPDPQEPPIKKGYQSYRKSYPQALILVPTRELASQIFNEARKFCYRSYVRPCVAYGGADIQQQLRLIDRGCHLLVATPGRLVDILERRRVSFQNIQYLVLDEADRMLDMGFEPQVRRIVEGEDMPSPADRQTLMFSATFPENIQALARDFMKEYVFLSVGRVGATSENITQNIVLLREDEKRARLIQVLEEHKDESGLTLIFTETKRMADTVCDFLNENNHAATAIHGDRVQSEREAALDMFRKGTTPIMVATAVAARGLDIPNVKHVISYDLPSDIDDYVHRIGRTGRAGNTGIATAFFTHGNRFLSSELVKLLQGASQQVPGWLQSKADDPENSPSNASPAPNRRNRRPNRDDNIGPRVSSFKSS